MPYNNFLNPYMFAGLTVAFASTATGVGSADIPAPERVSGNICVVLGTTTSGTTPSTPAGFTSLYSGNGGTAGFRWAYKVLDGTETTITPTNATTTRLLLFVPTRAASVAVGAAFNGEATAGNPALQTISASGYGTPSIILAAACSNGTITGWATESPALTTTYDDTNSRIGYKIYNSGPSNHTIDIGDFGTNVLSSGALVLT